MTGELFFGSLIVLSLVAVIIVTLTTKKRVNLSENDRLWHEKAAQRLDQSQKR